MLRATVGDIELAYVERGSGPVLLLVHGFPLDHSMWAGQVDALAGRYRVIAPDLRGFGQSSGHDEKTTMQQFAGDLVGLLDALGIPEAHIVGASMGGMIAQRIAISHPDRTRTLTSIASSAGREERQAHAADQDHSEDAHGDS